MKKKIINGILMVALLAATATSFVSCKDNDEDVKTDLIAQLNKQAGDLTTAYKQADTDLENALRADLATKAELNNYATKQELKDSLANYAQKGWVDDELEKLWLALNDPDDPNSVDNRLNAIKDAIEGEGGINDQIADIQDDIEDLQDDIEDLQDQIDEIIDALTNMVTSVTVNATSTNMLKNSKLFPGLNLQFLGAAFGQATTSFSFPSTEKDDFIDGHGVVLTKDDIFADVKGAIEDYKGYLPLAEEGAGTVYFTVNPSNIDARDAEKLQLSLVNSQNEESFVTLGEVSQDEETVLEWGLTRADEENAPKLWKADAKIDFSKAETLKKVVDPANQIDFVAIKESARNLFANAYNSAVNVNRNNVGETAKTTTKNLIKDAAQLVATLLQTEFPGQPALAVKAQWNDVVGTRSVLSDYSIAATAYKPLSFGFGAELGINGRTISLDKLDNLVARVINKVENKLKGIDSKVGKVNIDFSGVNTSNFNVYMVFTTKAGTTPGTYIIDEAQPVYITSTKPAGATEYAGNLTAATTYYSKAEMATEVEKLLNSIPAAAINDLVAEAQKTITSVISYADRTKNFEVRVSNYLESLINRIITKISADGLTRVLEPVMLIQSGEGVNRLVSGATIKAGEYDLVPTTMTYEVLAPAYKKYVAIIGKDGKARTAEIKTNGDKNFKKFTVTLEEDDQAIVYDALDFSGKQIAKKYAINVVK